MNDRALRNPRTGVGHYISELLAGLARHSQAASTCRAADFAGGRGHTGETGAGLDVLAFYQDVWLRGRKGGPQTGAKAPRRWSWRVRRIAQDFYNCAFEAIGAARGYRLYHEPNHIPMPWHGPTITTVHDLSVLRHPEWHPPDRVDWYERDFMAALPRSDHFIAVSEFTKREMVNLLELEPDRITVVPNGVRACFHPHPQDVVSTWCGTQGLVPGYVLYVGTIEPRKNLARAIEAYATLPRRVRERSPLVLAGMAGWGREKIDDLAHRHAIMNQVRTLGYVADEDLPLLYSGAALLLWPSLYEGFGLPPVEAMACGTPVIASDCSAIPEVVGDAGLLVDPQDASDIAAALARLLEDERLRARLREKGLARSAGYTWDACARAHAELYARFGAE